MAAKVQKNRIYASKQSEKCSLDLIQIDGDADAEAGACGERRGVVIGLRLVIKEVVDGGVHVDASPQMVLEHQFPDGITLIDIRTT